MSGNTDRRSLRTRKALKRGMLELLNKKDISKITVSELAELADIGRGTFYLHYSDPYDLLDKLEDELLEQITVHNKPVTDHWYGVNLLTHLESIWRYIYENIDTFKTLMNPRNGGRFMEKFRRYCEISANAGELKHSADSAEYYVTTYIISGSLGIFMKWMEEGAPIPPDRLAEILRKLIAG